MEVAVRFVAAADRAAWLRMRCALWPEGGEGEHGPEIERFLTGQSREPLAVLIAETETATVGFAELSIRPFAEGCQTQRVGYIEGWYVVPDARGQGVGRALIEAAELWAGSQGCREMASDAEPHNEISAQAHAALGFEDVGLVRCFRKDL